MTKNNDQSSISVQTKLNRLHELLAWFDSDEFVLEESITRFKQVEVLADEIEQDLTDLKNEINIVKQRFERED